MALGFVLLWGGYAIGSWGYVLDKGWNITLREWMSPLHPYQWPAHGDPPTVPQGQVFPSSKTAAKTKSSGTPAPAAAKTGRSGQRVIPGQNAA